MSDCCYIVISDALKHIYQMYPLLQHNTGVPSKSIKILKKTAINI